METAVAHGDIRALIVHFTSLRVMMCVHLRTYYSCICRIACTKCKCVRVSYQYAYIHARLQVHKYALTHACQYRLKHL